VRTQAKASSTGSNTRQGKRLGLLGALALLVSLVLGTTLASATAPVVTIDPAAQVGFTTAEVKGEVNPGEKETSYRFEYITDAQFDQNETESLPGFEGAAQVGFGGFSQEEAEGIVGAVPVGPAILEELTAATEYHLRLVAENEDGTESAATTFTTQTATAPALAVIPASKVSSTKAHIEGTVDPEGGNVNPIGPTAVPIGWELQINREGEGWATAEGGTIEGPEAESSSPITFKEDLEGLQSNSAYKFRLRATYAGKEALSSEEEFQTSAIPPELASRPSVPLSASSVRLRAYVNPRNSALTDCRFAWGADGAFDQSAPCDPMPSSGNSAVEVAATITGLKANTQYSFHLIATSAAGTSQGPDRPFAPFAPPTTSPEGAFPGQGFLPHERAWEMVSPPDKNGGDIIADSRRTRAASDGSAIGFISLVGFGDIAGTNVATDYISARSTDPDPGTNGWATHAVTPPLKPTSYQQLQAGMQPRYVGEYAEDLSRGVFYSPVTPLTEDPNTADVKNLYRRTDLRTPGAGAYDLLTACPFCATPLLPPTEIARLIPMLAAATPDLERIIFESEYRLTEDTPEVANRVRLFEWADGEVKLAGRIPVSPATSCDDVSGPACVAAEASQAGQGAGTIAGATHVPRLTTHTISDGSDGHSRVFFTWPTNSSGTATQTGTNSFEGRLYVRTDGHETVQMNVSERTTPEEFQRAMFWDATADGSRAFFSTTQALTENAQPGTNLYMYDVEQVNDETQRLKVSATAGQYKLSFGPDTTADIAFDASAAQLEAALEALPSIGGAGGEIEVSGGPGDESANAPYTIVFGGALAGADQPALTVEAGTTPLSGGSATATVEQWLMGGGHLTLINVDEEPSDGNEFRTFIGSSEDGSYAYFLSGGQLIESGPGLGENNGIYAWHEDTLALAGSMPNGLTINNEQSVTGGNYEFAPQNRRARLTPDGRHLLFSATSGSGLTGYDHGLCIDVSSGAGGCRELYVYDAENDELQCASCNPSGAAAMVSAESVIWKLQGGATSSWHQTKTLSADGRYAFFSSAEKLVPEDRNGVSDAYVYDTETGRPHLLSSGEDAAPSWFMDASANGKDAFFTTRERLSDWDVDSAYDVYDARVNGGFPEPPPPPPACVGDACQPPPAALNDSTPASSGFASAGDPKANRNRKARCPQGKRRVRTRRGKTRCVKKQSKRKRAANADRRAGR
jgi:hypothetical protein